MACFEMYQTFYLITLSLWLFEVKCMYSHQFADSPVKSHGGNGNPSDTRGPFVQNILCHLYKTIFYSILRLAHVFAFFPLEINLCVLSAVLNHDWFMHKQYWSVLVDLCRAHKMSPLPRLCLIILPPI